MKKASCLLYDEALNVHRSIKADLSIPLPSGELCKTRCVKAMVEDTLLYHGFGKDMHLLAYGGGATLDLAGYVAATYMRGITYTAIPTTLLAMVDVSIGGKNGINTPHGKNTLGTLYEPNETHLLYETLETLPYQEYISGIAEIIKLGAVLSDEFLRFSYDISECEYFVPLARKGKHDVVSLDMKESGYRRILNFGHTIGHALEVRDTMPHGHAVAIGMLVEAQYSLLRGYLQPQDVDALSASIEKYPFRRAENLPYETLLPYLLVDKKGGRIVVLNALGQPRPCDGEYAERIEHDVLKEAYENVCCKQVLT